MAVWRCARLAAHLHARFTARTPELQSARLHAVSRRALRGSHRLTSALPAAPLPASRPLLPSVSSRAVVRAAAMPAPLPLPSRLTLLLPRAVHRLELLLRERTLELLLECVQRRRACGTSGAARNDEPQRTIERRQLRLRQRARQLLGKS